MYIVYVSTEITLSSYFSTGTPSIEMGPEIQEPFTWTPVNPENISHLDIGNVMEMDQGLPNHRYVLTKKNHLIFRIRIHNVCMYV